MKLWLLNIGNSNTGKIGLCSRIYAETKEEALRKFIELVPSEAVELKRAMANSENDVTSVVLYINSDNITTKDITGHPQ